MTREDWLEILGEAGMELGWHNFRTGQVDWREHGPTTDEEAKQYLPQMAAAQNLYDLYRQMGLSVAEASIKVLQAATGHQED